jgi:hypothetical protein
MSRLSDVLTIDEHNEIVKKYSELRRYEITIRACKGKDEVFTVITGNILENVRGILQLITEDHKLRKRFAGVTYKRIA